MLCKNCLGQGRKTAGEEGPTPKEVSGGEGLLKKKEEAEANDGRIGWCTGYQVRKEGIGNRRSEKKEVASIKEEGKSLEEERVQKIEGKDLKTLRRGKEKGIPEDSRGGGGKPFLPL